MMIIPAAPGVLAVQPRPLPGESSGVRLVRTYSHEFSTLPGIYSIGYQSSQPDIVNLRFPRVEDARAADGLLRNHVFGATIRFTAPDGTPWDTSGKAPVEDALRALRVFSGVTGVDRTTHRRLDVSVLSRWYSHHLGTLLEPRIAGDRIAWKFPDA